MTAQRPLLVVMGVSGSGKSTLGRAAARALGLPFAEGDDLHPQANVAMMRAGIALTDADRAPWLARIADWSTTHRDSGGVITCSALRRAYRDRLRAAVPTVAFVHLVADPDTLRRRMAQRRDHFMPASLLESQLATLEPLEAEYGVELDARLGTEQLVADLVAWLR